MRGTREFPSPTVYTAINGITFVVVARFNLAYQNVSIYYHERSGDYYYSINDETGIQVLNAEMVKSIIFSMSHEIEYLTDQLNSLDKGLNTLEKIEAELLNKIPPVKMGKVFKQGPVKNKQPNEAECINSLVKRLRKLIDEALVDEICKQQPKPHTIGKVNDPNTIPPDVVNTESYPYNNPTNGFDKRHQDIKAKKEELTDIIKLIFGENFEESKKPHQDKPTPQEQINPNKNYKCPGKYKEDLRNCSKNRIDPFF
jgi:hypothetical protein